MNQSLMSLSADLAVLVEKNEKSVVSVEARRGYPSSGVVWSSDGLVLTAQHGVEWDEGIEVGFGEGKSAKASLVGRDPTTDVAVLRVDRSELAASEWTGLDDAKVGNLALGIARPGRLRATMGLISVLGGGWRTRAGGRIDHYLETDLNLYPGFSGSGLADASGRLLGLNTTGLKRGASLTVPFATLERVVSSLVGHGRVRRGFLGIHTYSVALPAAVQKASAQSRGLLVVSVQPESPADRAGVLLGDVVLAYSGLAVESPLDLLASLDEDSVGVPVRARILRAGETRDVELTPGNRENGL